MDYKTFPKGFLLSLEGQPSPAGDGEEGQNLSHDISNTCDQENPSKRTFHLVHCLEGSEQSFIPQQETSETENHLLSDEKKCRHFLEDLPVGLYASTFEGKFLFANKALVEILKFPDLETLLSYRTVDLYLNPADRTRLLKLLEDNDFVRHFETRLRCYNGDIIWVSISARLVTEKGKKILRGAIQDITTLKYAQKALTEIEAKFRTITEMAPDAIVLVDLEGRIVFWNKAAEKIFGYTCAEALGRSLWFLVASKRYYSYYLHSLIKLKETGKSPLVGKTYKIKAKKKNDTIFPVEISHSLLEIDDHKVLICMIRDITSQERAQKYIKRREEILKVISDAANLFLHRSSCDEVVNTVLNKFGKILDVDKISIYQIINDSKTEIFANIRYNWTKRKKDAKKTNLVVLNHQHPLLKAIQKKIPKGKIFTRLFSETSNKLRDFFEQENIKSLAISPIFVGNEYWGFIIAIQTSHERKWLNVELDALQSLSDMFGVSIQRENIAEELIKEKERLDITLKSIADGVIVTDTTGKIILINKGAQKILRQDIEVKEPVFLKDIFKIFYEKTRQPEDILEAVLKHKQTVRLVSDTILLTKNGDEVPIQVVASPIKDHQKQIIGIVIVFQDITRRRQLEKEILNQEKMKILEMLAGGIAHDFNNLLSAILGNISLAKIKNKEESVEKFLDKAEKATKQAEKLTRQLLSFTKAGLPVKKTTSIAELVKETTSFVLRGANVKVVFSIPDNLWPAKVDEVQIGQVIQNLVINAQQAMSDGGTIEISAKNVYFETESEIPLPPGPYICLRVKDEGCGIPPEYLSRIFDPYFTTKPNGSGLGLAVVLSIIKKHDGYIRVHSRLGKGTSFEIFLPAVKKEKNENTNISKEETLEKEFHNKGKILVLDDEELVRHTLKEMLKLLGYEVETASDGQEAIEKYKMAYEQGSPFQAIIMDLTVPGGMGGKEALAEILKIDPYAVAIVSTGYGNDQILAEYRRYGFKGFLKKPHRIEELAKVLQKVLHEYNQSKVKSD